MQIRGKPKRIFIFMLTLCFVIVTLLSTVVIPKVVYADKNNEIDQLIMVSAGNSKHITKMHNAVLNQDLHQGDAGEHKWVTSLDSVSSKISSDPAKAAKQAIIVWTGEDWLSSDANITAPNNVPVEGNAVDVNYDPSYTSVPDSYPADGDPDDSIKGSTAAERNAQRLDRALNGYDYYVESVVVDVAHKDEVQEVSHQENDYDANGNVIGTHKVIDVAHEDEVPEEFHVTTEKKHVKGYIEYWKEKGAKVYVFTLGPVSKQYSHPSQSDAAGRTEAQLQELENNANKSIKEFNSGLTKTIDIYQQIYDHNPYFSSGNNATSGTYYSDEMYAWIFHLMWNTILTLNPEKEAPEPIDQTLYSVSSSLTTYMNNVLSSAGDETNHATHTLSEASTSYIGNAGAFLGYGDKDYDFHAYITTKLSKTSSVVDYSGLLNIENASNSTNEMYLYSRYGRLLNDMGFDKTGTRMSYGSPHLISGALMFLVYVLSEGIKLVFTKILGLLQFLNVFHLFKSASTINANAKLAMTTGSSAYDSVPKVVKWVGEFYDGLSNLSMAAIVPMMIVMLIAGILLKKQKAVGETGRKIRVIVIRMVFICVGIPFMGMLYTQMLDGVSNFTTNAKSSGTQLVASTFVDFKAWVQDSRLAPVNGGTFESASTSDSDAGAVAGEASPNTYNNLRKTAALLNQKTGATSSVVYTGTFDVNTLGDNSKWTTAGLTVDSTTSKEAFAQVSALLMTYTMGDFYTAGTFESDMMSTITKNHSSSNASLDKIGRQPGIDEDNPPDNKDTLYELFDNTNEASDWLGRTSSDNKDIFTNGGSYSGWSTINLFSNGRLKVANNKSGPSDTVTYTSTTSGTHGGLCSDTKTGLSTLSMYNYLSTRFDDTQMTIYSNKLAASEYTKQQHYAVNSIGSGIAGVLYYLNCFAVMFVVAIIGFYYCFSMLIQSLKRGFHMILAIPGAMLGALASIVEVIVIVFMMILEIIGTMFVYTLISELLVAFVSILETGANSISTAVNSATIIGTKFATIGFIDVSGLSNTVLPLMFNLSITTMLLFVFAGFAKKYATKFVCVYSSVTEFVYLKTLDSEVAKEYIRRQRELKEQETERHLVPVFSVRTYMQMFVGYTKELLFV